MAVHALAQTWELKEGAGQEDGDGRWRCFSAMA